MTRTCQRGAPPPNPLVSVHRQSLPVVFPQSRPPEFSIECRAAEAAAANHALSAMTPRLREGVAPYAHRGRAPLSALSTIT